MGKYKRKWSVRTKLIAVLSLSVLFVSSVLLYVTTEMLYKDKRVYLFDSAFQTLATNKAIIDRFTADKSRRATLLSQLYQLSGKFDIEDEPDLLSVSSFSINAEEVRGEVDERFNPDSFSQIFLNQSLLKKYRLREDFIKLERKHHFKRAVDIESFSQKVTTFYDGRAPHLLVYTYLKDQKTVLAFDFLLDNIFDEALNRSVFEAGLMTTNGDVILFSKPGRDLNSYRPVLRSHLKAVTLGLKKPQYIGVNEVRFKDDDALVGLTSINDLKDIYFFTSIRSRDAYQMTLVMIASTFFFGLFLIGFFALAAIVLARMLTTPLETMTNTIGEISQGNFAARVSEQNTLELERLSNSFNRMLDIIQDYQKKLQDYSRSLEIKVQERTVDLERSNLFIRSVLDSLSLGLVVVNKDGRCLELHSKASLKIFQKPPPGKKLSELIGHKDETFFGQWIKGLFEEMIPFESLSELGPKIYHPEASVLAANFKHIRLNYFPVRDEGGTISSLILLATDSTQEYLDQLKLEDNRRFVEQVSKAIKNKRSFAGFVETSRNVLATEITNIQSGQFEVDDLKRNLHSLKGLSGFFSFERFAGQIHSLEDQINDANLGPEQLLMALRKLQGLFDLEVDAVNDFLGNTSPHIVEVDKRDLIKFKDELAHVSDLLTRKFLEGFLLVPISSLIAHYDQLLQDLALKLGKEMLPIEIEGGEIRVSPERLKAFFESSIHLFRNAIDHGIELPEERESIGKSRQGKISVSVLPSPTSDAHIYFEVRDDGRGIDSNKIREKLMMRGVAQAASESDTDVLYHIFDADFSTSEVVSEISGRGVGLFDVRYQALELGADVKIFTELGQGTRFLFHLPRW